jgi:hypothetical protein
MSERSEAQNRQSRKWFVSQEMEKAIEEAEPAADWLMRHPPGAKLPDELEPGYEPDEYVPESKGVDEE